MKNLTDTDITFMKKALLQAKKAYKLGEVPVGAVIVRDGEIISRGYNKKEKKQSASMHAEIIAITRACKKVQNWRLEDCDIYVTLEPCMMCLGAILEARIKRVIFGADDLRMGFLKYFKENNVPYAYDVQFKGGVLAGESSKLLKSFFRERRGG